LAFLQEEVQAQDKSTSKKQERVDRKNEKAVAFEQEKEEVAQLAKDRNLVLEANTLSEKFGYNVTPVGANNYLLIDSANFILQTSSPAYVGQNGIGGVTIRGTIESYEVTDVGKNSIMVLAQVNTFGLGPATITLNLIGKQNCRATFTTASGIVLNMTGPVSSIGESKLYQGIRLY
jgi:hypothetical protein